MSSVRKGWRAVTVSVVAAGLLSTSAGPVFCRDMSDSGDRYRHDQPNLKVTVGRPLPPGVPLPRVEVEVSRDRYGRDYRPPRRHDYDRYRYDWRRDYYRHYYRPHGHYYPSLPTGFLSLSLPGGLFYYHMGTYYRPSDGGYVAVPAPLGARIRVLPENCSPFYVDGRRYFVCDEVYYRPDGDDYVVIERPSRPDFRVEVGDEVRINADFLNMRSGPGQSHRVVGQLYRGDVVEVGAIEGDWYYVGLSDKIYGWVKREYTTLYRASDEVKG